uniref:Epithelial cell adhesion molecule n=1 Tax=Oreochromis niloticus TaxID=8128 RepID=I3J4J3_ORENI
MKMWIFAVLAALAVGASAQSCQSTCETMKWATCDGPPCSCYLLVDNGVKQPINCTTLVPKCFLMKAEMYRARKGMNTRSIAGKPDETAIVDNDGIYDPECESDGKFKAKQCNGTDVCWCVNSAGVRRTDKGDQTLKCEKLVETHWIRLQLTHKQGPATVDKDKLKTAISTELNKRYQMNPSLVKEIQYDPDARMIVVDVNKVKGDRSYDLSKMAYYMEKDVKILPLFTDQSRRFTPSVDGQTLEMENIVVYYVDEEAPTITMKHLTGGIIAVIVVVVLAVVAGLLAVFFVQKRQRKYKKTQQREMEQM